MFFPLILVDKFLLSISISSQSAWSDGCDVLSIFCNFILFITLNLDQYYYSVILYNFSDFLHNKVGKVIGETEKPQLYPDGYNIDFCKRGELVAINFNYANNSYYWGIYIEPEKDAFDNNTGEHYIMTIKINTVNNSNELEPIKISSSEIARVHGIIDQSYKPDHKIATEEELLETYIVSY